jgi:hypothetical protein
MSDNTFTINWHARARIQKYGPDVVEELKNILGREPLAADFDAFGADPDSILEVDGNILVGGGLAMLTNAIIAGSYDPLTSTRSFVGVGDSSTAAATAQTDLSAVTNKYYNVHDSNPTRVTTSVTNDTVQSTSTFTSGVANWAWQEWAWFTTTTTSITPGVGPLSGITTGTETMYNRKVASMGTKTVGANWVLTTSVQFS